MSENVKKDRGLKSPKSWIRMILVIILTSVIIFSQAIGLSLVAEMDIPPLYRTALAELVPLILATLLMIALGGRKWLGTNMESIRYAFKVAWVFPALGLAVSIWRVISSITSKTPLTDGFLINLVGVILACVLIGYFEEILYRGINFGSMLALLGSSKKLILLTVLISSWTFGRVHVTSLSLSDPMVFIQSILKIIQTGMLGVVMCEVFMHTKKIGGPAILHAANDLMLMITGALYEGKSVSGVYVNTDATTGGLVIIVYLFMIAVYLYPTITAFRRIWKDYDECYGPFVNEQE